MNTITLENTYQLPTYEKIPLVLEKGKGCFVWDNTGKKYLDFYSGHAVALIGHCHPEVIKAVTEQMKKLIFYSNIVYNSQRAIAAKKIITYANNKFSQIFFCNSGTEANETALKIAKKYTGKDHIISFKGSFHGRTIGSLSVTGIDSYKNNVGSILTNISYATFGDSSSVIKLISPNTAAIILEPLQSIAGVTTASKIFYKSLKNICIQKNIVLIFDEVQTGLGRTGKKFFADHFDIDPDIITLAKGLAGGLPAGAVLVNKQIKESVTLGDQGSTFGGSPVICAAITAVINILEKDKLHEKAANFEKFLKEKLIQFPHVLDIHGKGLLLGITLDIPAKKVMKKLLDRKIITSTSYNPQVLRIIPPLIITEKEITFFLSTLKKILEDY